MREKKIVEQELQEVLNSISSYSKELENKMNEVSNFFKKKFDSLFNEELKVAFDNARLELKLFRETYSIYMFLYNDDLPIQYDMLLRIKTIATDDEKKKHISVSDFFNRLLYDTETEKEIRTFHKNISQFISERNIDESYKIRESLQKELKCIEVHLLSTKIQEADFYKAINPFKIRNNIRKRTNSWHNTKRISIDSIVKVDSVSKRGINFNVTIVDLIRKETHKFSKVHTNFIQHLLNFNYIKIISKEDAFEMSMEIF